MSRRVVADDERGSVTVFVVGVLVALIVLGGLVFDGGNIIAGHREADAEAEGAARAGAQAVAGGARLGQPVSIDPAAATAAAQRYLAPYDHTAEVTVTGDVVTATVTFSVRTQVLGLVGLTSERVTGTASATALEGS